MDPIGQSRAFAGRYAREVDHARRTQRDLLDRLRESRKVPLIELAVVVVGTMLTIIIGVLTGVSQGLQDLIHTTTPGHSIADIGPGLLFFATGLGIISVRRWADSERKRHALAHTQDELLQVKERYRSLVELSPDPVVVVVDGGVAYANPAALRFLRESSLAALLSRRFLDIVPAGDKEDEARRLDEVADTGDPAGPVEHPFIRADGSLTPAECAMVRTTFDDRPAVQVVIRDLTTRRAADEAALRYHALAENSEDVVTFADPDGRILDCNRAAELRYGYTKEELLSRTLSELRPADADSPTAVQLAVGVGQTVKFDTVHVRKDGTPIEFSVTAQRISLAGGDIVVSVGRDVTERHRALRELEASEARYRALIVMSPAPVAVVDGTQRIAFANDAMLRLLRAPHATDVIGHRFDAFVHPDSMRVAMASAQHLTRDASAMASETRPVEVMLVRVDGTVVSAELSTTRTTFDGSDGVQAVLQDVTHLKDVAATLRRTTEDTISAMARLAETRDPYTSGHQARVAAMSLRIARRLGLSTEQCDAVRLAATVHDIGKLNVPAEILSKPGQLTSAEFEIIKCHAERGYEVLRPIEFPWPIAEIVRQHHERLDGSGYPLGLRGDRIRTEARVIAVADTVEAISSDRPYRPALGLEQGLRAISEGRGILYDAACVDACMELAAESALMEDAPPSAPVRFSDFDVPVLG
jgi:PAS domain S-box-containing protein/putative nucleotidyltransferase with HDIG domain